MWGKGDAEEIKCSEVGQAPDIYIEAVPRQKIAYLMEAYHHQEWLAYMVGKESDKGNFFVEDLSIPPHKFAGGGSAEAEPFNIPERCIGVIHSHHGMGAFHSGTDQAYVDRNFPISITVARGTGESLTFDAISVKKTPCGKRARLKCDVYYVQPPPLFDKDEFLKKAKENIDKGKGVYVYPRLQGYGGFPGYGLSPYTLLEEGEAALAGWDGVTYEYDTSKKMVPKLGTGKIGAEWHTPATEVNGKPKWGQNGRQNLQEESKSSIFFPRKKHGRNKIKGKEKKELKKVQEILKGKYNVQLPLEEVKRLVDQGHYHGIKLEDVKEIKEARSQ